MTELTTTKCDFKKSVAHKEYVDFNMKVICFVIRNTNCRNNVLQGQINYFSLFAIFLLLFCYYYFLIL